MFWNKRYARDGWAIEDGQYQRATRGRVPEWYARQPPTTRGDYFYLNGFAFLGTERQFPGNGMGPIPWSKAYDYAARNGFDQTMSSYFAEVIMLLDGHYRDHLEAEHKKDQAREDRRKRREAARKGPPSRSSKSRGGKYDRKW